MSLFGLAAAHPAAAQTTTVYSNNFTDGAGAGWSTTATDTTPGTASHAADKFLGQFGNQTTTLTLGRLATHSTVNVPFDLYMIRTMDGNGTDGGGPDPWSLMENGSTLISTNFANWDQGSDTQSFGGSNGSGGYLTGGTHAPYTGATEAKTLGYLAGDDEDAVYHLSFTFNDTASALAVSFIGGQNQAIDDESWGLDNVVVKTGAPVPEAPTLASFGLLLALGLSGFAIARRRKAPASAE